MAGYVRAVAEGVLQKEALVLAARRLSYGENSFMAGKGK
jgi:hypothetical protein